MSRPPSARASARRRRGLSESPSPYGASAASVSVGVTEFKAKCLGLIDDVAQGRTAKVVLTRRGVPVAEIVAPKTGAGSLYGCMKGTVTFRPDVDLTQPTGEIWDLE